MKERSLLSYNAQVCIPVDVYERVNRLLAIDSLEDMSDELAEMLDLDTDDESFYWDSMYINLPDSLVKRIKDDAVREYLKVGRDDGQ